MHSDLDRWMRQAVNTSWLGVVYLASLVDASTALCLGRSIRRVRVKIYSK